MRPCRVGEGSATNLLEIVIADSRKRSREKRSLPMKPNSYKYFAACALTALGVTLAGCQQAPPAATAAPASATVQTPPSQTPPPTATTDSSSSRSVEVKPAEPGNPDSAVAVEKKSTKSTTTTTNP